MTEIGFGAAASPVSASKTSRSRTSAGSAPVMRQRNLPSRP
jgi:hypothetical protein